MLRLPDDTLTLEYLGEPFYLRVLTKSEEQARGFQLVEDIRPNEGLVFVLPKDGKTDFWMKNVLQKLDIVFIDELGVVVGLVEGSPNNKLHIVSPPTAVCAVELPRGLASKIHLQQGKKLSSELLETFQDAYHRYY